MEEVKRAGGRRFYMLCDQLQRKYQSGIYLKSVEGEAQNQPRKELRQIPIFTLSCRAQICFSFGDLGERMKVLEILFFNGGDGFVLPNFLTYVQ